MSSAGRRPTPDWRVMSEATTTLDELLVVARQLVADAHRIVVLTGAGISTASGIPDFRGPQGVWTKDPEAEKLATIEHYLADPAVRRRAWQVRRSSPAWAAAPNAGHMAIVELERAGRLDAVVTQNIDGLHQRAGNDPARVVEVHGTIWFTRCWSCDDVRPMAEALARLDAGEADPPCEVCGGIIKSDTISFGQGLVPAVIDRAFTVSVQCDLLLAVGSTLSVYPVARCVPLAKQGGAAVVIVNGSRTDQDDIADVVLRGDITELLPRLADAASPGTTIG